MTPQRQPAPIGLDPEIAALIEALAQAQVRREDRAASARTSQKRNDDDA